MVVNEKGHEVFDDILNYDIDKKENYSIDKVINEVIFVNIKDKNGEVEED